METTAPICGEPEQIAPGVVRLLAPNPSPMTHWGTNTYLLGHDRLIVVDPGPALAAHEEALIAAIARRTVSHIVVTHAHLDHSALAPALAARLSAPVVAFGAATAGRSAVMTRLAHEGLDSGGEGIDHAFAPDITVGDGDVIDGDLGPLAIVHTPGHLGSHICLRGEGFLLTGDHVMGWAPSLVSPPDGDLTDFMASCTRLRDIAAPADIALPGHGAVVRDPAARIDALIAHRRMREGQILAALRTAPGTPADLARRIYTDVPKALLPAATRNVLAHLIDLTTRNLSRPAGKISATAIFEPI